MQAGDPNPKTPSDQVVVAALEHVPAALVRLGMPQRVVDRLGWKLEAGALGSGRTVFAHGSESRLWRVEREEGAFLVRCQERRPAPVP